MQTNQYQEIEKTLPKRYILIVFELVTYKKRENWCKALYIRKQKDFARKVYNEFFYSSKEPKGKKHKNSWVWRRFLDIKMMKLMNNTLNWETEQYYQMRVFCVLFTFLLTKSPNCMWNHLYVRKKWNYQKKKKWHYLLSVFERNRQ